MQQAVQQIDLLLQGSWDVTSPVFPHWWIKFVIEYYTAADISSLLWFAGLSVAQVVLQSPNPLHSINSLHSINQQQKFMQYRFVGVTSKQL